MINKLNDFQMALDGTLEYCLFSGQQEIVKSLTRKAKIAAKDIPQLEKFAVIQTNQIVTFEKMKRNIESLAMLLSMIEDTYDYILIEYTEINKAIDLYKKLEKERREKQAINFKKAAREKERRAKQ